MQPEETQNPQSIPAQQQPSPAPAPVVPAPSQPIPPSAAAVRESVASMQLVNKTPLAKEVNTGKKKQTKDDKKRAETTQNALLISEVRDGLVIMRDGSLRAVVMCQSINFDLMSPEEREAIEFSYQGFINSLFFDIQIFIRSQRVDLNNYIDQLQDIHANQENVLLSLLMEDYITYVRYLVEAANVMDKQFYVVIPYDPPVIGKGQGVGGVKRLFSLLKPGTPTTITINETEFNKNKEELTQRVQTVLGGLNQLGVQAVPLNTQELIELYYSAYNPQTAARQRLSNFEDLETPMITKGQGDAPKVMLGEQ